MSNSTVLVATLFLGFFFWLACQPGKLGIYYGFLIGTPAGTPAGTVSTTASGALGAAVGSVTGGAPVSPAMAAATGLNQFLAPFQSK